MAQDELGAHSQDELGISEGMTVRPIQAALTSGMTFAIGGALPLLIAVISTVGMLVTFVTVSTLLFLALLGAIGA
jgi:vacuolar iron transporter family protein